MMENAKQYKYPKGETVWTGYYDKHGELKFIVTSKPMRDNYFLYELVHGVFKKLGRSKNPTELENKFDVLQKMRE